MIKGLNIILRLLLVFFPWFHLAAQDALQTLTTFMASIEDDHAIASGEQLYVFTDRKVYFAGETAWFGCHFIGHDQRNTSFHSKVVYLELLNPGGMPIIQQKIQMTGAYGNGEFVIPDTLSTGKYLLRAYTQWMRNFGQETFFYDGIQIFNPGRVQPSWVNGTMGRERKLEMAFFPEGGTLYTGIENKVAVTINRFNGAYVSLQCTVCDDKDQVITGFKTNGSGLGGFYLTPEDGASYYCRVQYEGEDLNFDLPIPQQPYVCMQVNKTDPADLIVSMHTGQALKANDHYPVHLVIQSMGEIRYRNSFTIQDTIQMVSIPRAMLLPGINQFLLFDQEGQLRSERLVLIPVVEKGKINLAVTDQIQVREKVNVDIQIDPETFIEGELTRISVSVAVPTRPFNDRPMLSHYYVSSFLNDPLEADKLLREIHQGIDSVIDLRMLTLQSYKYHAWGNPTREEREILFPQEKSGMHVTGNLVQRGSGIPVANELLYLSFPGFETRFAYAFTGPDGGFRFFLPEYYGTRDLIIQPARLISEEFRININNPFSLEYISWNGRIDEADTIIFPRLREWSINAQLQYIYGQSDRIQPDNTLVQGRVNFYGTVDKTVALDDFITLPVMEEVFHELVYGVRLRKEQSDFKFVVLDKESNTPMAGIPSVFLDGVYVHNPNQIAEINPEQIKWIEVVREAYQTGDIQMDGIISIYSRDGDFHLIEMPVTAVRRTLHLFDRPGIYTCPEYADPSSVSPRIADMRNTLFWGPDIPVDKEGKATVSFYSSDYKSEYEILVQGITDRGEIIFARKTITVK